MSGVRRVTFVVWALLMLGVGAALLLAPGRFLGWFGWAPVEPILSRILGAALLALSWLAVRGLPAAGRSTAAVTSEVFFAFSALAAVGMLRHLTQPAYWPPMVWAVFAVLAVFTVLWLLVLITGAARR